MLNRINLTLSALTNRLNLGTRALGLNASVNNGDKTLRIRHFHHDVMRQSMVWYVVPSSRSQSYDIPPMPDSIIPGQQQRPIRCAGQEPSRGTCQLRALPKPSQAWSLKKTKPGQPPIESRFAFAARTERPGWVFAGRQARGSAVAARAAAATA